MNKDRIVHIEDIDDDRVALYTKYNEPQLFHYNEPGRGVFIAETPMVIERALDLGLDPVSFFVEKGASETEAVQKVIDRGPGADIFEAELDVINRITGFNLTRGLLAVFERPALPEVSDLIKSSKRIAVLEGIVNPTNVGAIFRSGAALGVDAILVTSDSTDPFYRRSARVSMGTVFQVPWTYIPEGYDFIEALHDEDFSVISMALSDEAVPLTDPVLKKEDKRALIFGSEGDGIKAGILNKSDHIAIIPMYNGVDSLNVAASSAVAFWELCSKTH